MRYAAPVGLALTLACLVGLDLTLPGLGDEGQGERALASVRAMLSGIGHPDLGATMLRRVATLAAETTAIAVVGTAMGAVAGLALAVLAASPCAQRSPSAARRTAAEATWLLLDGLRALPDFVWALAVLLVLGPGPITGTVAIAVSVTGILGRAFGRLLVAVPPRSVRAIERLGGSPAATLLYGRLPRVAPAAWSYGLARLECSMRNASVIGVVGGGGLGAELFEELGYGRMDRMATLLLGLLVLTLAADTGASVLRRRLSAAGVATRTAALRVALIVVVVALVPLLPALETLSVTLSRLDPRVATQTLSRLVRPDLSVSTLREAALGVGPPLALAWLSTLLATSVAFGVLPWTSSVVRLRARGPAAATRAAAVLRSWLLRGVALVARGVPEVAWLLLLAAAMGVGQAAALLALTLHGAGVLTRLFTEAVDDRFAPRPRERPGLAAGTGWLVFAALPRLAGTLRMHVALQGESNLRTAYALGMLGAGGLGESFYGAMSFWQLERASTLALTMLLVFVGLDRLGRGLGRLLAR